MPRPIYLQLACLLFWLIPNVGWGQSSLVLRDLSLVTGVEVESFDLDSVRLSNGSELSWDLILQGKVAAERQKEFDQNLVDIGLPLFQLKQRIKVQDWTRLKQVSETLMIRYSGIDSATSRMVCLAVAKSKIETGRRAEGVLPFMIAASKNSAFPNVSANEMGFTESGLELGLTNQLVPIWFDLEKVRAQKLAIEAYQIEMQDRFPNAGFLYLASFCLALDELDEAKTYAEQVDELHEPLIQWKRLMLSEIDRRTRNDINQLNLFQVDPSTVQEVRVASQFFDAVALDSKNGAASAEAKILEYLKVPARGGSRFPNLSAAAIHRSIELAKQANMTEEAKTLTSELFQRYPNSYHGKLLESENPRLR